MPAHAWLKGADRPDATDRGCPSRSHEDPLRRRQPDRSHAMLADPAFREEVCDYQRALRRTRRPSSAGRGRSTVVNRPGPGDQGRARRSPRRSSATRSKIVQPRTWATHAARRLRTSRSPASPATCRGTDRLADDGDGTSETVSAARSRSTSRWSAASSRGSSSTCSSPGARAAEQQGRPHWLAGRALIPPRLTARWLRDWSSSSVAGLAPARRRTATTASTTNGAERDHERPAPARRPCSRARGARARRRARRTRPSPRQPMYG